MSVLAVFATRRVFLVSNQPRQTLPRRSGSLKSRDRQFCCLLRRTTVEGAFDVIVVGLDAMGSATAYHLSKQHTKVLGLEAFIPAHDKGSSQGESRIIRQAYFQVLLMFRSYYELTSFGMSCKMKVTKTSRAWHNPSSTLDQNTERQCWICSWCV